MVVEALSKNSVGHNAPVHRNTTVEAHPYCTWEPILAICNGVVNKHTGQQQLKTNAYRQTCVKMRGVLDCPKVVVAGACEMTVSVRAWTMKLSVKKGGCDKAPKGFACTVPMQF